MGQRSIEFGWGAPSFAQQMPALSAEDAATADAFNQAIIRLSVHGLLSGAERDRAIKRTTRWIEDRLKSAARAALQKEEEGR
ncbi:hypothetical protein NS228_06050 [Methylobacterium indicum]|uniref:hypothetical protein n=1 Tax=Methylobacterium indicum TaxID=1775910 RepID=UPI000733E2D4|nr:hypothetical protein [Methylobacterium indicum]KTS30887.1 hypothetical protein NS229_14780 [Methylobacterium indicum]KTS41525.1 hypothetical protein NS228_06050 [Methylobacterium indicum]KTS52421.1 hypothetical protein NS230_09865 [Methylobacterium indicum]